MSIPQPTLDSVTTIREDGSRRFVHTADVRGRFTTWRALSGWFLIALYILLPWIPVNGNPAIFLDIAQRRFHLLGITLAPQDFWFFFFLIAGAGFALFYITALFGRLWCGWLCPHTVFLDQVFRLIERWTEGNAIQRRTLEAAPWDAEKSLRRSAKLALFLLVCLILTHVFLSYFVSVTGLYRMMTSLPTENWGAFLFVAAFTGALFFHFVWFREQLCIVLCPYGRLQSALIDDHSIVIGYDRSRGEPRGKLHATGAGDCIDCHRCVQVCPTGIDIRQGLQMECISCSNCIDACNAIMTKIGRPLGLIRYDSMMGLAGGKTHFFRPRILLYTALMIVGVVVMGVCFSTFRPATLSVMRMTGAPYYIADGSVRNQFLLRIINKRGEPQRFTIHVSASQKDMTWNGTDEIIEVPPQGEQLQPLVLVTPQASFHDAFSVRIEVHAADGKYELVRSVPFLGPSSMER